MIDIRKLKELVRLMVDNDLTELDLRDSEEQVTMRRSHGQGAPVATMVGGAPLGALATGSLAMHGGGSGPAAAAHRPGRSAGNGAMAAGEAEGRASADAEEAGLLRIESPMVGTFYAQANPDSPPFASAGTVVAPDKVVCIIEAMKIFNEIKAECTGTIHKVLVRNGEPVEFGQTLFLVKPG